MPLHLLVACVILIASLLVHAALAPYYETGSFILISPIIFIGLSVIFFAFIKKRLWSWQWAFYISLGNIVIHSLFLPTPEFFGEVTPFAQVLFAVELITSFVIFLSMFTKTTKNWFFESNG
ncbi:MAG: hypothetical protein IPN42_01870 [Methylococcaceae bacterium]|nr:hypothetical protein [Methylococcaceae bacterium]